MVKFSIYFLLAALAFNAHAYESVFYCTYQNDDCVDFDKTISVDKTEIEALLQRVAAVETNFIGFVDPEGTTIQFYVDAINDIWVEIPFPAEQGSYGKHIDENEFTAIVKSLKSPYIIYKESLNLKFRAW